MVFQTDNVQEIIRGMFSEAIFKVLNMEMAPQRPAKEGKQWQSENIRKMPLNFFIESDTPYTTRELIDYEILKLILNSKRRQLFKISKDKDISPFVSLYGRHSKGKGKKIWVQDRAQGRREEGIA